MTIEQIVAEVKQLPSEQWAELRLRLDHLSAQAIPADTRNDSEWLAEINQRVSDFDSGKAVAIPGEEVRDSIRRLVGR